MRIGRRRFLRSASLASTAVLGGWFTSRAKAPGRKKKVLFFSKASDATHRVTDRIGGRLSYAEQILAAAGGEHGIEFTFSQDGSLFAPAYLAQFDAFCFQTSGDLLAAGKPRRAWGEPGTEIRP